MSAVPVAAEEQALACFGNEPSWSVVLDGADGERILTARPESSR